MTKNGAPNPTPEQLIQLAVDLVMALAVKLNWTTFHAVFCDGSFFPVPCDRQIIESGARRLGLLGIVGWAYNPATNQHVREAQCWLKDPQSRRTFAGVLDVLTPAATQAVVAVGPVRGSHVN